jgi:uncharacterized membrane protein
MRAPDWAQALGGAAVVVALAGLTHLASRADWTELAGDTLAVKVHLAAALGAVGIGAVLMTGRKGAALHKRLGWTWAGCMMLTALSSFFIRRANGGDLSWIHALSGWVVIALPMALAAARGRRITTHRRMMSGMFYGGLLIAGAFAFVPGRVLFRTFFG